MALIDEIYLVDIRHKKDFVSTSAPDSLGDIELESGRENVRMALFRRLMTSPGTIVHRPNYGVGIKDYQNSVSSLEQQRSLAKRIADQFEEDNRVKDVLGVRIDTDDETPEKTVITVRVELIGLGEVPMDFTPFGGEIV